MIISPRAVNVSIAVSMLTWIMAFAPVLSAQEVIATSGFNDGAGIHSDPFLGSPFVSEVSVNNQGDGEPGWAEPWRRLGGFEDRAHVVTDVQYEGDQSVTLWRTDRWVRASRGDGTTSRHQGTR